MGDLGMGKIEEQGNLRAPFLEHALAQIEQPISGHDGHAEQGRRDDDQDAGFQFHGLPSTI